MSYGIISAWKSASEHERIEQLLHAIIQSDKEYIIKNCATDIEFIDLIANTTVSGASQLADYLTANWNLAEGSFEIVKIEMSYADKSETASFEFHAQGQKIAGLMVIEESNGLVSSCKIALKRPE